MGPLLARTDNEAARLLSKDGSSWRTRHFAVKAEGLRQQVALGLLTVEHVAGVEQKADGLTKTLPVAVLEKFRKQVGLISSRVKERDEQTKSAKL
eukprot:6435366-Amphidinium_carterae.1